MIFKTYREEPSKCRRCDKRIRLCYIFEDENGQEFPVGIECFKEYFINRDQTWKRVGLNHTMWQRKGKKLYRLVVARKNDHALAMVGRGYARDDLAVKWKKYDTVKDAKVDIVRHFNLFLEKAE